MLFVLISWHSCDIGQTWSNEIEPGEPRKNRESRIEDGESKIENRESRIDNREWRMENRESRIENSWEPRIEDRKSGLVKPRLILWNPTVGKQLFNILVRRSNDHSESITQKDVWTPELRTAAATRIGNMKGGSGMLSGRPGCSALLSRDLGRIRSIATPSPHHSVKAKLERADASRSKSGYHFDPHCN